MIGPTQDLLESLVAAARADSVLNAASPAGPSLTRADETRTVPYIVVSVSRGGQVQRFLGGDTVASFSVSFSVVAGSAEQSAQLSDRVQEVFDGQAFTCAAGVCLSAYTTGAAAVRQIKHISGVALYETVIGFSIEYYYPAS